MFEVMQSRMPRSSLLLLLILASGTMWPDVLAALGILYTTRTRMRRSTLGSLRASGRSTNLNAQTGARSYSSTRGMSFAYDALW